MTERWMSVAEAEELYFTAGAIYKQKLAKYLESHDPDEAIMARMGRDSFSQAINEATVRPGDAGWCRYRQCYYALRQFKDCCAHPNYREGHCPKGEK